MTQKFLKLRIWTEKWNSKKSTSKRDKVTKIQSHEHVDGLYHLKINLQQINKNCDLGKGSKLLGYPLKTLGLGQRTLTLMVPKCSPFNTELKKALKVNKSHH